MSTQTPIRRRATLILILGLALSATPVASAATPSWYPQLHIAVADAGDAGAAIDACAVPRAGKPKAGSACSIAGASDESSVLDRVAVFAEMGEDVGPCRRLLFKLDHTATVGARKALTFATSKTTLAQEVSGRHALEKVATHVTADFAAIQHCLGKS